MKKHIKIKLLKITGVFVIFIQKYRFLIFYWILPAFLIKMLKNTGILFNI
jgi:hypothetical protein